MIHAIKIRLGIRLYYDKIFFRSEQHKFIWSLWIINASLYYLSHATFYQQSASPQICRGSLRQLEIIPDSRRFRVKFLKDGFKFMFRKDSLYDALQDDDDQPLVEGVVLEHVKEHLQPQPAGLASDHSLQLVWEAGEEQSPRRHACPHLCALIPRWIRSGRESAGPEIVLRGKC